MIAYPHNFAATGPLGGFPNFEVCVDADGNGVDQLVSSVTDAVDSGARIINMSFLDEADWDYYRAGLHALRHGVILVSARDNSTEAGLYDLWDLTVENLLPYDCGKTGFGANYKNTICKIYRVAEGE